MEEKDNLDSVKGNFKSIGIQTDAEEDDDEFTSCVYLERIEREIQDLQLQNHDKCPVCCEQTTLLVQNVIKIIDDAKVTKNSESEDPIQKALSNSLIVRKILGFLPSRDLFSCRRVCTIWAAESTSLFLSSGEREEFLEVKFTWSDSGSDSGTEGNYEHDFMGSLHNFTQDFFSSEKFPCSQFSFIGGDLNDKNLIDFFEKYGHRVKFLSLNPDGKAQTSTSTLSFESLKVFHCVVFEWAQNLKCLDLCSTKWMNINMPPRDGEEEEVTQKTKLVYHELIYHELILPNLKILKLPSEDGEVFGGEVIKLILNSAINLTHIFDPCLNFSEEIVSSRKFHLIDSLILRLIDLYPPNSARIFRFVNSFSQSSSSTNLNERPRLKSIHFDPFSGDQRLVNLDPRVVEAITWIFSMSQETLENLKGIETLSIIPNLQLELPQLPSVKSISIQSELYEREILPCGRDENQELSFVLPELEHLTFEWISMENNPLESNLNSHSNVKELDLFSKFPVSKFPFDSHWFAGGHGDFDEDFDAGFRFGLGLGSVQSGWITRAGKLYPHVHKLCITLRCKNEDAPEILKSIWSAFQNLEFLSIIFQLQNLHSGNAHGKWKNSNIFSSEMDEAFTGFSLKLCKKLRRDLNHEDDEEFQREEVVEKLREQPSICHLKRLKTLEISGASCKETRKFVWSHVTELFAFQPLTNKGVFLKIS